jgi:hypothetical protein
MNDTFYIIYKLTNVVNNKIYIGAHVTKNVNDEYMGSGHALNRAKKKYGIEKFKKEILHVFDNEQDMWKKELEIVNEEFCKDPTNYNIRTGGIGGWNHWNGSERHREASKRGGETRAKDPTNLFYSKEFQKKYDWTRSSEHMKAMGSLSNTPNAITKKKETFKKIKHGQGEKNSQFGRYWISNIHTKEVKRISMHDTMPVGWVRGKKGHVAKKLWVNNNIKEHYILTEKEQDYIIKGFNRGRLKTSMPQKRIVV